MNRMQGKVALISGGAEGIGAAVARLIVAEGGSVMLGDVQLEKAQELAA
jgi:3alpha(or 20beta)-hydroxysteroid dehydrogenase